jgi:hypothetical protein
MAMLFLSIFATLAVAMAGMSTINMQSASNLADVDRARAVAESGLRWQAQRFIRMTRPRTTIGNITPTVAESLWPAIKTAVRNDYALLSLAAERAAPVDSGDTLTCSEIALDAARSERFQITIQQDAEDERFLIVTSTGRFRDAVRSVSMRFQIDKKVKYAVVGRVPIQLGRNTIVEGPVGMGTANKFPPILMLSDFTHFDATLAARITAWNNYLQAKSFYNGVQVNNHEGFDNRVNVNNPMEYQLAAAAGFTDTNGDSYIDEYDLFLDRFDTDDDKRITASEFTNPATGNLYDPQFFKAIDSIGAPLFDGDVIRAGYLDGVIDNFDGYAKLRGNIALATTEAAWTNHINSTRPAGYNDINDYIQGVVATDDPTTVPVKFAADTTDIFDLAPQNFEQCAAGFRARSGSNAGTALRSGSLIANTTLSAADANAATTTERTPLGSTSYQATFVRPTFRNMTFRNVTIPKGLNALFDNCTFEGVTFVEGERDIVRSNNTVTTSSSDGMSWAQRRIAGDTFSKDKPLRGSGQTPTTGQTTTHGSTKGNNLRFNNSTFKGPIAGNYATAYTHFANSWEFTGSTMFDNQVDQTATIVSPQVNIEMGSFTDPSRSPSTLIGVVVAGNIDIRGSSSVDGSIIITGDGAGNTTLAYFGASDGDTSVVANPEGGFGRLNIRYNPSRTLPDGINIPIDILPLPSSYLECSTTAD